MDNSYNCTHCKYSYARMNCSDMIRNGCAGCPRREDKYGECKCCSHSLVGEDCPDFELAEDVKR